MLSPLPVEQSSRTATYPKTLIVGTHFSSQSGSGTYLSRLFTGWPAERLATVCASPLPPDLPLSERHYRLGAKELSPRWPYSLICRMPDSASVRPAQPQRETPSAPAATGRPSALRSGLRSLWNFLLRPFADGDLLFTVRASPELIAWCREFSPDVIYGHCSTLNSVLILREIQRALNLPLVVHFMDDWPRSLYQGFLSRIVVGPYYLANFSEVVRVAATTIAISDEMAAEYSRRYRRPMEVLPIPASLEGYVHTIHDSAPSARTLNLRYGGRVGWAIRESLADIARAVTQLRSGGADVVFDIATFNPEELPESCRGNEAVRVLKPCPLQELPRAQASASILVICYDFDSRSYREAKYSMPSKMADCMASGTPILVYGPAGLPVVEYARRAGWGVVVDVADVGALEAAIRSLLDSVELRQRLGAVARRLAFEKHDASVVSAKLREICEKAASVRAA